MIKYDIAVLSKLTVDMVALHVSHVLPKRPCELLDISREFMPLGNLPCKFYLLRNGRAEEIPEEDFAQSTETYTKKDSANSNKNITYIIVFDRFGLTKCAMLHFNLLYLQVFKELKEQLEKAKARANGMLSSPPMIFKFVFLASFNGVSDLQRVQNALELKAGVEWSVKEAVPIPSSQTVSSSHHNKSENQAQSPQNNLNDEPIDYFSSRIKSQTDPSSLTKKQYILSTTLKKKCGSSVTITRESTDASSNDNQYSLLGWILLFVIIFAAVPVFALSVLSTFDPELAWKVLDNYFLYIKKVYYLVISGVGIVTSVF